MDDQTRKRIIAEETGKFMDANFGQLDLTGSPDLAQPVTEKFEPSDRYGLNNVEVAGANQLRQFCENPDDETIERIAEETSNPALQAEVDDIREEQVARAFLSSHPSYHPTDSNYQAIRDWLDENDLPFDGPNLDKAFRALTRSGELEPAPGVAKPLSDSERLHVISLCKTGQIEDAIGEFLAYSLPNVDADYPSPTEFLSDPATLNIRNSAVNFVWFHSRSVIDSRDWDAFQKRYFKLRPLRTLADMDSAYAAFLQDQRTIQRNRIIDGNAEPAPQAPSDIQHGLDALDDSQLEATYRATLRHYAKSAKSGGILV